jgi:glycosyltransferase involved in cell wall biosynthesis
MAQELTQGGSERQLTEVVKAIDRNRFEPHVAVLRSGGLRLEELRNAGVPWVCVPLRSFASPAVLSAGWQLSSYLRRNGVRLAHSFDVPTNVFLAPVARASGVPVVLSSQRAFRSLTPRKYFPLVRFSDRLVDGIVVNCRAIERHLTEDEKIPASLLHLCYNGINTETFHRRSVEESPQLAGASLVVGVVCALRPEKDLPTLVKAIAMARAQHPGMRLVIVGSGPLRGELEQLSDQLGQRKHCVFVPMTPEVPEWLSRIDIFVLPSLSEALSNSLMEAMVCGCVAVASNVGGNPELVASGERGLLFQPGDAEELARHLGTLAADEALRRRYAEAGCRFIKENFSLAASVRRMADIYVEMIARKRR